MGDRRPLAERPDVVQMADERLAVELAPGDRLRFGLKNVDVIRRSVFRSEVVRAEKEIIGATLRPGRRDDVPQPPLGVLEPGQSLLRENNFVTTPPRAWANRETQIILKSNDRTARVELGHKGKFTAEISRLG
jgi:hypothetical protein